MASRNKPIVWSIGGSDSGGGAGIQADLFTFRDFGVYGCNVVTALTAQNSFAVGHVAVSSKRAIAAQLNALDSDLNAEAIKIGMLASAPVATTVANYLGGYQGFIVYDPVVKASSGDSLLTDEASKIVREQLLPQVDLLTPNRSEAEALVDEAIETPEEIKRAAIKILNMGVGAVLITGGHFSPRNGRRLDFFMDRDEHFWLAGPNIDSIHTHGSGCTLSSAIAALVARGYELKDALVLAKAYVTKGMRYAYQVGGGPGPVAHMGWPYDYDDMPLLCESIEELDTGAFPDCGGELGIYPVVDSVDWVRKLADEGVSTLQLRIKDLQGEPLEQAINQAVSICKQRNVRLFINDHWPEAIVAGAYGVHLGQEDLDSADLKRIRDAGLHLGVSTHCHYEVARARAVKPSYIALGPIFATDSKQMRFGPQGLTALQRWVDLLGKHHTLTAIGGIDLNNAPAVLATGVGSCAMISAITKAEDYRAACRGFLAMQGAKVAK